MLFSIRMQTTGTKLTVTSLPFVAEGTVGTVGLHCDFDECWEGFSRRVLLRRAGSYLLSLELNALGETALPPVLTSSDDPFYLSVEGVDGEGNKLSTNTVCLAFRNGEPGQAVLHLYDGPYHIDHNGAYPTASAILTQDFVVEVPQPDLSADTVTEEVLLAGYTAHDRTGYPITGTYVTRLQDKTAAENGVVTADEGYDGLSSVAVAVPQLDLSLDTVTEEVLLQGYTAHDASGNPITGSYDPASAGSARFHVTYSETPPTDTEKLWAKTAVQPVQELSKTDFPQLNATGTPYLTTGVYFPSQAQEILEFGQSSNVPYLVCHSLTQSRSWVAGDKGANQYDWRALDGCLVGDTSTGKAYILLGCGYNSATNTYKRPVRILTFDFATETATVSGTLNDILAYSLTGGILSHGGYLYYYLNYNLYNTGNDYIRMYRYDPADGTVTQIGTSQVMGANTTNGMALGADGKFYMLAYNKNTKLHYRFDPATERFEELWSCPPFLQSNLLCVCDGKLLCSDTYGLMYIDIATGKQTRVPLALGMRDSTSANSFVLAYRYVAWLPIGRQVFVIFQDVQSRTTYKMLLSRSVNASGAVYLFHEATWNRLSLLCSGGSVVETDVGCLLVTDAAGNADSVPLYRYDNDASEWVRVA